MNSQASEALPIKAQGGERLGPADGSMPELIALADTLCEKVGAFGFYHWEGTAKEMFDAAKAYAEARKASNDRTHRREAAVGDSNQTRTVAAASRSVQ